MTRGRRPDPTLQPSRQLQTARAFRERKAAHLRSLEERVKEQDAEILQLKAKLGIEVPPSPTALDASITNGVTIKSSRDSPAPHVPSNAGQEEIKPSVKRLKRESSSSDGGSSPPCSNCAHMSEKMTKLTNSLAALQRNMMPFHASLSSFGLILEECGSTPESSRMGRSLHQVTGNPSYQRRTASRSRERVPFSSEPIQASSPLARGASVVADQHPSYRSSVSSSSACSPLCAQPGESSLQPEPRESPQMPKCGGSCAPKTLPTHRVTSIDNVGGVPPLKNGYHSHAPHSLSGPHFAAPTLPPLQHVPPTSSPNNNNNINNHTSSHRTRNDTFPMTSLAMSPSRNGSISAAASPHAPSPHAASPYSNHESSDRFAHGVPHHFARSPFDHPSAKPMQPRPATHSVPAPGACGQDTSSSCRPDTTPRGVAPGNSEEHVADEDKCCLGIFECDPQGRIIL